jgi:hypothetical protein
LGKGIINNMRLRLGMIGGGNGVFIGAVHRIGFYIAGPISDAYKTNGVHDWRMIWLIPSGIAAVVMLLFLALFKTANRLKPYLTNKIINVLFTLE